MLASLYCCHNNCILYLLNGLSHRSMDAKLLARSKTYNGMSFAHVIHEMIKFLWCFHDMIVTTLSKKRNHSQLEWKWKRASINGIVLPQDLCRQRCQQHPSSPCFLIKLDTIKAFLFGIWEYLFCGRFVHWAEEPLFYKAGWSWSLSCPQLFQLNNMFESLK